MDHLDDSRPTPEETSDSAPREGAGEPLPVLCPEISPPSPSVKKSSRILTAVCAFFCAFSLAVLGVNLIHFFSYTEGEDIFFALANRAFLGCAAFTRLPVSSEAEPELFPFPPAETEADKPEPAPEETKARYPIERADLAGSGDVHTLFNETAYSPDTSRLLEEALPFLSLPEFFAAYGTDAPYILILHTHGTEGFAPEGAEFYTPEDPFRSQDPEKTVVAVGAAMAEVFENAGITVLHCTEMFDRDSYRDSYTRSAAAVRDYLTKYPSIQIVLDVHRDSVIRSDKTKIRPVTAVDGADTAQFMLVVGTDAKGADHPDWQDNLNFALKIQENLSERAPRFARSVNLRGAAFNQQYRPGSLLLEVGSCGNTLAEAKRAAQLAAQGILSVIAP